MLAKFSIDYVMFPRRGTQQASYSTDDPVEAEEVLMSLLRSHARVTSIRHEGVALTRRQSDQMLKIAAERIVSDMLRESLAIDAEEVKDRFGFAA